MPGRFTPTYYLDAYLAALGDPPMLREARALLAKTSQAKVQIPKSSLIVGEFSGEPFDFNYAFATFIRDPGILDEPQEVDADLAAFREKVKRVLPCADGSALFATFTQSERDVSAAGLAASNGFGGHMTFDYRYLLGVGIPGLESEIDRCGALHSGNSDKEPFFEAMRITLQSIKTFIRRHAGEAERMAGSASGESAERLARIARDCHLICEEPPRTFAQALQLLWFLHILNDCDSFGRFDWALEDYYTRDLATGVLTREQAAELLQDIWPRISGIQNMTLGGQYPDGRDSCSELTLLIIEIMHKMAQPRPNLCLRVHSNTPEPVWEAAVRCIGGGTGCPALYNDDVIISALIDLGVDREDAYGYSLAGCSQVVIPGKCNFGCDDGIFNAAKCLELALRDGVDPLSGKRIGPSTGAPESIRSWDQLWDVFAGQVASAAMIHRDLVDKTDTQRGRYWGYPLRSLLTQDCLSNAFGIWEGGAKYNAIQTECLGITNAADSLTALKKLVFEESVLSLSEMVGLLDSNWEGAEATRLMCLSRASKFGNDDPEADAIASRVARSVWEEIRRHRCTRGSGWIIPGGVIFTCHVSYGKLTGATPDGRRKGEPLADSSGPAQGRDRNGPTAALKSVCKLPLPLATTCPVINLKFPKRSFAGDTQMKMRWLFQTYFAMGGMQLQVSVVDREALLNAQRDPESFRGLIVRVGGYSEYFGNLPREFQDEIISRTQSG